MRQYWITIGVEYSLFALAFGTYGSNHCLQSGLDLAQTLILEDIQWNIPEMYAAHTKGLPAARRNWALQGVLDDIYAAEQFADIVVYASKFGMWGTDAANTAISGYRCYN